MAQKKMIVKVKNMTDDTKRQKAFDAALDIYGVDGITADMGERKLTITGEMDTKAIAKKLKKVGKINILFDGPANEEKKEEKKGDDKKKSSCCLF